MGAVKTKCNVCGQLFEHDSHTGTINCPDCVHDKAKKLNRMFTKDTVWLVCKWYNEYMAECKEPKSLQEHERNHNRTVRRIAEILTRSTESIEKALREGEWKGWLTECK